MLRKILSFIFLLCLFSSTLYATSTATVFDTDTKLMLHMNDSSLTDSSSSPHTITLNGNVARTDAQSVFGGYSAVFDGSGDYLSVGDSSDWTVGSGDFTFDCRVRFSSVGDLVNTLFAQYDSAAGTNKSFTIDWVGYGINILRFIYSTDGVNIITTATVAWSPSADTWYHIAIVRSGNSLYFFVGGNQVGSTIDLTGVTLADVSTAFTVGALASADNGLNGYIDEARYVKGTAVWTSNFTSPSAAYTAPSVRRRVHIS